MWLMPPRLHGAYGNYYYVLQLQAFDGVIRYFYFLNPHQLCDRPGRARGGLVGCLNTPYFDLWDLS